MHGIVPSLNTPFNAAGELDLYSLSNLVDHSVIAGCGGMLGLAVAGEQNRLTVKEKINFIDLVVNKNDGRIPFICSVTASSISESIKLTTHPLSPKRPATAETHGAAYMFQSNGIAEGISAH